MQHILGEFLCSKKSRTADNSSSDYLVNYMMDSLSSVISLGNRYAHQEKIVEEASESNKEDTAQIGNKRKRTAGDDQVRPTKKNTPLKKRSPKKVTTDDTKKGKS